MSVLTSAHASPTVRSRGAITLPAPGFFLVLLAAVGVDLGTKQLVATLLGDHVVSAGSRFSLMLMFNTGGAGGYQTGPSVWLANVAVTAVALVAIMVIAGELHRLHGLASVALGLVAGGALGNLSSMLFGPDGVADFLAFHLDDRSIVFNVADLSLWTGALLLIPVVRALLRAIAAERREKQVAASGSR